MKRMHIHVGVESLDQSIKALVFQLLTEKKNHLFFDSVFLSEGLLVPTFGKQRANPDE